MQGRKHNPYTEPILSPDDLPDDIDTLKKSIIELLAWLRGKQEEFDPPGFNLTRREAVMLSFILAGEATTSLDSLAQNLANNNFRFSNLNTLVTEIHHLNSKLRLRGIRVRAGTNTRESTIIFGGNEEDIAFLMQKVWETPRFPEERLAQSMRPFSTTPTLDQLPSNLGRLRQMNIELINYLRGNPARLRLPLDIASHKNWVVILGTLYAKPGLVTRRRLTTALFLPFGNPPGKNTMNTYMSSLRAAAATHEIEIVSHSQDGEELTPAGRERLEQQFMIPARGRGRLRGFPFQPPE